MNEHQQQYISIPSNSSWTASPQWYPKRPDWMTERACAGIDPDVFFPERGEDFRIAKSVCKGCPVKVDCLNYALSNNEQFGIWGGTSPEQRRRIRREQRAEPLPPGPPGHRRTVLEMAARGASAAAIASDLGITASMVYRYLRAAS